MSTCQVCRDGEIKTVFINTWMCERGEWIHVVNVPCTMCEECGDVLYSQSVSEALFAIASGKSPHAPVRFLTCPEYDLANLTGGVEKIEREDQRVRR